MATQCHSQILKFMARPRSWFSDELKELVPPPAPALLRREEERREKEKKGNRRERCQRLRGQVV